MRGQINTGSPQHATHYPSLRIRIFRQQVQRCGVRDCVVRGQINIGKPNHTIHLPNPRICISSQQVQWRTPQHTATHLNTLQRTCILCETTRRIPSQPAYSYFQSARTAAYSARLSSRNCCKRPCSVCAMTHSRVCHDSVVCAMTHSCVRHDSMQSFVVGTVIDSCVCYDSFIHVCAMTHSRVCHHSFMRVP